MSEERSVAIGDVLVGVELVETPRISLNLLTGRALCNRCGHEWLMTETSMADYKCPKCSSET